VTSGARSQLPDGPSYRNVKGVNCYPIAFQNRLNQNKSGTAWISEVCSAKEVTVA
jgi:hypothetical protein